MFDGSAISLHQLERLLEDLRQHQDRGRQGETNEAQTGIQTQIALTAAVAIEEAQVATAVASAAVAAISTSVSAVPPVAVAAADKTAIEPL